jgi:formylglycine-generating enzyme required for sulfatase activity
MPESRNQPLGVFLCRSSKDQSTARELYRQLKSEKWMDVWFIEESLLPSQNWALEIRRALQSLDVLVVLHSIDSLEKEETSYPDTNFVLDILHKKPKRSIPIIVLRLDDGQVPVSLKTQWVIDYFPKFQRRLAYQNLLDRLKFRAEQLGISMNVTMPHAESEKILQWSSSHWKELIFESNTGVMDNQLSDPGKTRSYQNLNKRITNIHAVFCIVIGLFALIILDLLKNYLVVDTLADHHTSPLASRALSFQTSTPGIGSLRSSPKDSMKIVYVPAGEFMMGGEVYYDEKPVHTVNLNAFWIDQTEVSNNMFAAFITEEGNREEGGVTWLDSRDEDAHIHLQEDSWQADQGYEDYPVIEVTWYGANAYCFWAGRRLPTEAEWEKTARGTTGNIYPWGNDAPTADLLNFNDNMGGPTKVGSYPNGASPYGALDMSGNVWEWVADRHSRTYYAVSPVDNPIGPETGFFRVLRGGAWNYRETYARSIHRNRGVPIISHDFIGFRCASDSLP